MKKRIFVIYIVCMLLLTSFSFIASGENQDSYNYKKYTDENYKNNLSTSAFSHYVFCFIIGTYDEKTKLGPLSFWLTSDKESIRARGIAVIIYPRTINYEWYVGSYEEFIVDMFIGICFAGFVCGIGFGCNPPSDRLSNL